jgi:hypothetical protein
MAYIRKSTFQLQPVSYAYTAQIKLSAGKDKQADYGDDNGGQ